MDISFDTKKFILALLIIGMVLSMAWAGKIQDPQGAVDFIKWVFITYCGSEVGNRLADSLKRGKK